MRRILISNKASNFRLVFGYSYDFILAFIKLFV